MSAAQEDVKFTGADCKGESFLYLNAVSYEAAEEMVAQLKPHNGDPDAEYKRRGRSGGHYLIAELNKDKKTYIAIHAFTFPGSKPDWDIQWRVCFSKPFIVQELQDNPGHFTSAIDGPDTKYVEKSDHLDNARILLAQRLLQDGLIPPKLADEISNLRTYSNKFTQAHCDSARWLTLSDGSPELVQKLEASFSPPNGDPSDKNRWKKTVGWVLPSAKGENQEVAIKVDGAFPRSATVTFMKPVYVEKTPVLKGHYTPQYRLNSELKTQGNTSDLRESMKQLVEKLTAEGFIDQALGEEITRQHEEYLRQDLEKRRIGFGSNNGQRGR